MGYRIYFPQGLMDLRRCTVLQGFNTLAAVFIIGNKGLACEVPSPPQCFKNRFDANLYTCEWRVPASMTNATFDLHFRNADGDKWGRTIHVKENKNSKDSIRAVRGEAVFIRRRFVVAERLITNRSVYIWMTAHMGNASCVSANTSVILSHTVKYAEPLNVSKSWSTNNLRLSWKATEKTRAAVQLLFRRHSDTTAPWENRSMETDPTDGVYQVTVLNLQRDSAYQVQIRQKSSAALNALWSDWSEVQMVPIVIDNPPKVTWQEIDKGTHRVLSLTWKPPSLAAAVGGVTYCVNDSQCCRCWNKPPRCTNATAFTMDVSYSPVNISIIAMNQVGQSPPAVLKIPVKLTKDIKPCDKDHLLWVRRKPKSSCVELYTFQHGHPIRVKTLPARKKYDFTKLLAEMEDFVRYYSFEHKCINRTQRTIKMCLCYKKEGAPRVKPPGLAYNKSKLKLWWKAIPVEDQRGFLTHYTVCITKSSTQDLHPNEECHNVSASHTEHPIDNLSPGFMYNISVVGVTEAGAGPKSIRIIKTAEESTSWKNGSSWSALVVVFVLLFHSILCTFIFKRFKKRILPPVPVPVLHPTDTYCPEEMLEMKEEVHKLTLHRQPSVPDITVQTPEDQTETTAAPSAEDVTDDDDSEEEDSEHLGVMGGSDTSEGPCDEPILCSGYKGQGLKPCGDVEVSDGLGPGDGDSEVVPLMYRNGLVFDMKLE